MSKVVFEPIKVRPRYKEVWRTHHGHRVVILLSAMPGPARAIETMYLNGPVNGHKGINFQLDGRAVMGDDWLVAREQEGSNE